MLPLNEKEIRSSFINASLRERKGITLPTGFGALDWDSLDFLGWRDEKIPSFGYVVGEVDGAPVGVLMRQIDGKTRSRPQCSWCEDVNLPNDVVFFNAKRGGQAGRDGDTIGMLVCAKFECPANVRTLHSLPYIGFDREAERQRRIGVLREHIGNFLLRLRNES